MTLALTPQALALRESLYTDVFLQARAYLSHEQATQLAENVLSTVLSRINTLRNPGRHAITDRINAKDRTHARKPVHAQR